MNEGEEARMEADMNIDHYDLLEAQGAFLADKYDGIDPQQADQDELHDYLVELAAEDQAAEDAYWARRAEQYEREEAF